LFTIFASGKAQDWFASDVQGSALLLGTVGKPVVLKIASDGVSSYECSTDLDEAFACAAWFTTRNMNKPDTVHVVRIKEDEIAAAGLAFERDGTGETGVVVVDKWHVSINGRPEGFEALMGIVHRALMSGEDRVRKVSTAQLVHQLARLKNLAVTNEISGPAKGRTYRSLGEKPPYSPKGGSTPSSPPAPAS
jgi:hypothetical protein